LYDIDSGKISIDGESIKELNLDDLRSAIGYVPQEVFLFSETINNNIAFGLKNSKTDNLTFDKVTQAAKDAAIFDSIMEFPNGFETKVGERGLTLSGGQKQRISIARAIIRKPAILLFDDCLSAVDTETEETILQNLRRIMANRTTIIISHRISSVKQCDEIIVLDHGHVSERGTHQYLLSLNGQYAEMHQKQLLDEEINPIS
jgi:ATP-binding cassette subfamily B protein